MFRKFLIFVCVWSVWCKRDKFSIYLSWISFICTVKSLFFLPNLFSFCACSLTIATFLVSLWKYSSCLIVGVEKSINGDWEHKLGTILEDSKPTSLKGAEFCKLLSNENNLIMKLAASYWNSIDSGWFLKMNYQISFKLFFNKQCFQYEKFKKQKHYSCHFKRIFHFSF